MIFSSSFSLFSALVMTLLLLLTTTPVSFVRGEEFIYNAHKLLNQGHCYSHSLPQPPPVSSYVTGIHIMTPDKFIYTTGLQDCTLTLRDSNSSIFLMFLAVKNVVLDIKNLTLNPSSTHVEAFVALQTITDSVLKFQDLRIFRKSQDDAYNTQKSELAFRFDKVLTNTKLLISGLDVVFDYNSLYQGRRVVELLGGMTSTNNNPFSSSLEIVNSTILFKSISGLQTYAAVLQTHILTSMQYVRIHNNKITGFFQQTKIGDSNNLLIFFHAGSSTEHALRDYKEGISLSNNEIYASCSSSSSSQETNYSSLFYSSATTQEQIDSTCSRRSGVILIRTSFLGGEFQEEEKSLSLNLDLSNNKFQVDKVNSLRLLDSTSVLWRNINVINISSNQLQHRPSCNPFYSHPCVFVSNLAMIAAKLENVSVIALENNLLNVSMFPVSSSSPLFENPTSDSSSYSECTNAVAGKQQFVSLVQFAGTIHHSHLILSSSENQIIVSQTLENDNNNNVDNNFGWRNQTPTTNSSLAVKVHRACWSLFVSVFTFSQVQPAVSTISITSTKITLASIVAFRTTVRFYLQSPVSVAASRFPSSVLEDLGETRLNTGVRDLILIYKSDIEVNIPSSCKNCVNYLYLNGFYSIGDLLVARNYSSSPSSSSSFFDPFKTTAKGIWVVSSKIYFSENSYMPRSLQAGFVELSDYVATISNVSLLEHIEISSVHVESCSILIRNSTKTCLESEWFSPLLSAVQVQEVIARGAGGWTTIVYFIATSSAKVRFQTLSSSRNRIEYFISNGEARQNDLQEQNSTLRSAIFIDAINLYSATLFPPLYSPSSSSSSTNTKIEINVSNNIIFVSGFSSEFYSNDKNMNEQILQSPQIDLSKTSQGQEDEDSFFPTRALTRKQPLVKIDSLQVFMIKAVHLFVTNVNETSGEETLGAANLSVSVSNNCHIVVHGLNSTSTSSSSSYSSSYFQRFGFLSERLLFYSSGLSSSSSSSSASGVVVTDSSILIKFYVCSTPLKVIGVASDFSSSSRALLKNVHIKLLFTSSPLTQVALLLPSAASHSAVRFNSVQASEASKNVGWSIFSKNLKALLPDSSSSSSSLLLLFVSFIIEENSVSVWRDLPDNFFRVADPQVSTLSAESSRNFVSAGEKGCCSRGFQVSESSYDVFQTVTNFMKTQQSQVCGLRVHIFASRDPAFSERNFTFWKFESVSRNKINISLPQSNGNLSENFRSLNSGVLFLSNVKQEEDNDKMMFMIDSSTNNNNNNNNDAIVENNEMILSSISPFILSQCVSIVTLSNSHLPQLTLNILKQNSLLLSGSRSGHIGFVFLTSSSCIYRLRIQNQNSLLVHLLPGLEPLTETDLESSSSSSSSSSSTKMKSQMRFTFVLQANGSCVKNSTRIFDQNKMEIRLLTVSSSSSASSTAYDKKHPLILSAKNQLVVSFLSLLSSSPSTNGNFQKDAVGNCSVEVFDGNNLTIVTSALHRIYQEQKGEDKNETKEGDNVGLGEFTFVLVGGSLYSSSSSSSTNNNNNDVSSSLYLSLHQQLVVRQNFFSYQISDHAQDLLAVSKNSPFWSETTDQASTWFLPSTTIKILSVNSSLCVSARSTAPATTTTTTTIVTTSTTSSPPAEENQTTTGIAASLIETTVPSSTTIATTTVPAKTARDDIEKIIYKKTDLFTNLSFRVSLVSVRQGLFLSRITVTENSFFAEGLVRECVGVDLTFYSSSSSSCSSRSPILVSRNQFSLQPNMFSLLSLSNNPTSSTRIIGGDESVVCQQKIESTGSKTSSAPLFELTDNIISFSQFKKSYQQQEDPNATTKQEERDLMLLSNGEHGKNQLFERTLYVCEKNSDNEKTFTNQEILDSAPPFSPPIARASLLQLLSTNNGLVLKNFSIFIDNNSIIDRSTTPVSSSYYRHHLLRSGEKREEDEITSRLLNFKNRVFTNAAPTVISASRFDSPPLVLLGDSSSIITITNNTFSPSGSFAVRRETNILLTNGNGFEIILSKNLLEAQQRKENEKRGFDYQFVKNLSSWKLGCNKWRTLVNREFAKRYSSPASSSSYSSWIEFLCGEEIDFSPSKSLSKPTQTSSLSQATVSQSSNASLSRSLSFSVSETKKTISNPETESFTAQASKTLAPSQTVHISSATISVSQQTPTLSRTVIPPPLKGLLSNLVASPGAQAALAVASALLNGAAFQTMFKSNALSQLASCGGTEDASSIDPLGFVQNPTGIEVTSEFPFSTYRGALVSNFPIVIVSILFLMLLVTLGIAFQRGISFGEAALVTRFPSLIADWFYVVGPVTIVTVSTLLAVHHFSESSQSNLRIPQAARLQRKIDPSYLPLDIVLSVLNIIFAFLVPVCILTYINKKCDTGSDHVRRANVQLQAMLLASFLGDSSGAAEGTTQQQQQQEYEAAFTAQYETKLVPVAKKDDEERRKQKSSSFLVFWRWLVLPEQEWKSSPFVRRHGRWFDFATHPMFSLFHYVIVLLVGGVGGIAVACDTESCCINLATYALVFCGAHTIILLITRCNWFLMRLECFLEILGSVTTCVFAALVRAQLAGSEEARKGLIPVLHIVVAVAFMQLAFVVIVFFYDCISEILAKAEKEEEEEREDARRLQEEAEIELTTSAVTAASASAAAGGGGDEEQEQEEDEEEKKIHYSSVKRRRVTKRKPLHRKRTATPNLEDMLVKDDENDENENLKEKEEKGERKLEEKEEQEGEQKEREEEEGEKDEKELPL